MGKDKQQPKHRGLPWGRKDRDDELRLALTQAQQLFESGTPEVGIELLEPFTARYAKHPELFLTLGIMRVATGDTSGALTDFEHAQDVGAGAEVLFPIATLRYTLNLHYEARAAARAALRTESAPEAREFLEQIITEIDESIAEFSRVHGANPSQAEKAFADLGKAQRMLWEDNLDGAITLAQNLIRRVADWPEPHRILGKALSDKGQPVTALAAYTALVECDPQDIATLAQAMRFAMWSGHVGQARTWWTVLQAIQPQDIVERALKADGAALMEDDAALYALLRRVKESDFDLLGPLATRTFCLLALAEANLGRHKPALRRIKKFVASQPWDDALHIALEQEAPGPGWATRYPYFHSSDLLPMRILVALDEMLESGDGFLGKTAKRRLKPLAEGFPQLLLVGRKWIWEEGYPKDGIDLLLGIGTPDAVAIVREFAHGQAGDRAIRTFALIALREAGHISDDEPVRFWEGNQWRELQMRTITLQETPQTLYSPTILRLIEQGTVAIHRQDYAQSERIFDGLLKSNPEVRETYNNLATIYTLTKRNVEAKAMFEQAVSRFPNYAFPRINLAGFALSEGNLARAKELLAPLSTITSMNPEEMRFYFFTQARVAFKEDNLEQAENLLELTLQLDPDFAPARQLLETVTQAQTLQDMFSSSNSIFARYDFYRRRRRLAQQNKLTTREPKLADVVGVYTREALGTTAYLLMPGARIYSLRKAELQKAIIQALADSENLARLVETMPPDDRIALCRVVNHGGVWQWDKFDHEFGNDLEQSPDWQYHEPTTIMGRLRRLGLLAEARVDGELWVVVPLECRAPLHEICTSPASK